MGREGMELVCAAELAWALIKLQCMARSRSTIAGEQGIAGIAQTRKLHYSV